MCHSSLQLDYPRLRYIWIAHASLLAFHFTQFSRFLNMMKNKIEFLHTFYMQNTLRKAFIEMITETEP